MVHVMLEELTILGFRLNRHVDVRHAKGLKLYLHKSVMLDGISYFISVIIAGLNAACCLFFMFMTGIRKRYL